MIKESECHSLNEIAEYFKLEPIESLRWVALGYLKSQTVGKSRFVLHQDFIDAIPRLSSVPLGVKRGKGWFDRLTLPKGSSKFKAAISEASDNQKLSVSEVRARVGERAISLTVELNLTSEITEAIERSYLSGSYKRVKRSIGGKPKGWEPSSIAEAYCAERLITLASRRTESNLAKLYESKESFDATMATVITDFLSRDCSFTETVSLPGRLAGNANVSYSLANNLVFDYSSIAEVANQVF